MCYKDGYFFNSSNRTMYIQGLGGPNLYILFFSNKQGHGLNRKQKDLVNRI